MDSCDHFLILSFYTSFTVMVDCTCFLCGCELGRDINDVVNNSRLREWLCGGDWDRVQRHLADSERLVGNPEERWPLYHGGVSTRNGKTVRLGKTNGYGAHVLLNRSDLGDDFGEFTNAAAPDDEDVYMMTSKSDNDCLVGGNETLHHACVADPSWAAWVSLFLPEPDNLFDWDGLLINVMGLSSEKHLLVGDIGWKNLEILLNGLQDGPHTRKGMIKI